MSKYALIGDGKTGQFVKEILGDDCTVFNIDHQATVEDLKKVDCIICFVPTNAFKDVEPTLLASNKPVVIGTTGIAINEKLNAPWMISSNFAMGMGLIWHLIKKMSKAENVFESFNFHIHEIHHVKKLDAPSGTAKSWKIWLGNEECEITSERIGDVVGVHELTLTTPSEKITLRHESLDRKVFARGAIWAANYLLKTKGLKNELIHFEELNREAFND